jgi:putative Holliday junction resolvase
MTRWRRGVRLGVDVGAVRIGVAVCDPDGILATPLVTVARDQRAELDAVEPPSDIVTIARFAREHNAVEVIVGVPVTLSGVEGAAAASTRRYGHVLAKHIDPVPVRYTDERMSTVTATRRLSERGVRGRRQRAVVDQAAAVVILQSWLDACRPPTGGA